MNFSKNVSFKSNVINLISRYMHETKKNFSITLNIMVEEWEKYKNIIEEIHIEQMKKAKVIKPMDEKSKVELKKTEVKA